MLCQARSATRAISRSYSSQVAEKYFVTTYKRPGFTIVRGEGCKLYDSEGKEYLDFTSGIAVTSLGHTDPEVARIISDQAGKLIHSSNLYHNEYAPKLAAQLVETTIQSGGMHNAARVFFSNSGTEANEAALKFARKVGGPSRSNFVSFKSSFHGRSYGSLSATCNDKYQAPFAPLVPGFSYATLNDVESLSIINESTAAVILEPIQGEGGINVVTPEFACALRKKCTEAGALLIYDEVQCGMGRTGDLWAHQEFSKEGHPDILTTAKALGNGFPIGATITTDAVNDELSVGNHGNTYGGNPLGCRVASHVLSRLSSPELLNNVFARSQQVQDRAKEWAGKFKGLVEGHRGRGLLLGLQLTKDPAPIIEMCREHGLLVIPCGINTIRIIPPLTVTEAEISHGLKVMEKALRAFH